MDKSILSKGCYRNQVARQWQDVCEPCKRPGHDKTGQMFLKLVYDYPKAGKAHCQDLQTYPVLIAAFHLPISMTSTARPDRELSDCQHSETVNNL